MKKLEVGNVVKNHYGSLGIITEVKASVWNDTYYKVLSFAGNDIHPSGCRFVAKNVSSYIRKYVGKYDNLQKG